MAKGNTPLDHRTVTNEPHLRDDNGLLISFTEFEKRCHVLTSTRMEVKSGVRVRRYGILFGRDDEGKWKYFLRLFVKEGGKKKALQRAFKEVKDFAYDESLSLADFEGEIFDWEWNKKVPLSF